MQESTAVTACMLQAVKVISGANLVLGHVHTNVLVITKSPLRGGKGAAGR